MEPLVMLDELLARVRRDRRRAARRWGVLVLLGVVLLADCLVMLWRGAPAWWWWTLTLFNAGTLASILVDARRQWCSFRAIERELERTRGVHVALEAARRSLPETAGNGPGSAERDSGGG